MYAKMILISRKKKNNNNEIEKKWNEKRNDTNKSKTESL